MKQIGVLISGRGSNLQAIIDAGLPVAVVISNDPSAFGLERAKKHNIPAVIINHKDYKDKNTYELEIVKVLQKHKVDLVCLAGYMRIVGEVLLQNYPNKILNIHPALLPSFPGLHSQKQALAHGVKISGCTVHFVDEGCDTGPIIMQAAVPVVENDTEETLSARILEQEHIIYPQAIKLVCEGRIKNEKKV
ncbi:phosphoribosylglycinamide formyltransferase [candidate division WOR-1 bacterium RIFOXYA12_FULL_43_27]|uniref:Phosphoribosylglycinamide formyltransferase n=1 Tax=candidate division WOR-1 bacterium RIFOXYC2_FULL_46_14 TaxID=1802587 RepID=A0A1F4U3E1_UNCSA|nr:MAG: phosphoribosylglycinamide formyltransferase [candidate division WOR-1 bacterium RIFOXYA12_FULL_43_27]OGC20166.1 MAG: phosphoribosylglycinamide formyltransferase [candidate division WOR-1 bacterium RIFOXYB2_FULL_46_45]OGC32097.1 MAG: phosphoribosylglycinamide formyltransferase [candidate division WOR-1 bacterium RIFOXYA2_FULL_46_56]OGC39498.1 MAG: phosphoribosylglycinamide formyltransferase [candidate division WOR-1 bacterium RIFOXYC2_FULL_46_14]